MTTRKRTRARALGAATRRTVVRLAPEVREAAAPPLPPAPPAPGAALEGDADSLLFPPPVQKLNQPPPPLAPRQPVDQPNRQNDTCDTNESGHRHEPVTVLLG